MYAEAPVLQAPNWPQQARQRLRVSMLLSTIFIATILTVLRFPVAQQTRPFAELLVQILVEEVESVVQPTNTDTISGEKIDEAILSPVPERVEERSEPTTGFPDWYAQIPAAASAALDHAPRTYSVNPAFDKKRLPYSSPRVKRRSRFRYGRTLKKTRWAVQFCGAAIAIACSTTRTWVAATRSWYSAST